MIEYIVYAALISWSSLVTWFVTKSRIRREQVDSVRLEAESAFIAQQQAAINQVFEQNTKIQQSLKLFQTEVLELHAEVLALRGENTALKFEICQLNSTIKLLTRVNQAERSFEECENDSTE
jgi:peptidoglycan hydrolase CwlO-like protein